MRLNLNLSQKGLLLVAALLSIELIFIGSLAYLLNQAEYEIWRESHARAVIAKSNDIMSTLYSAAGSMFSYAATGNPIFGERIDSIINDLPEEFQSFQQLYADSPGKKMDTRPLREHANRILQLLRRYKSYLAGTDQSLRLFRHEDVEAEMQVAYRELSQGLQELMKQERQIAAQPPVAEAKSRLLVKYALYAGISLNIGIAILLALWFSSGITRRLAVMSDNTERLAKGQPLNSPLPGGDEIAKLDHTFHELAEALQELDRLKRQFFAMVTHDLRSPLTSVRGTLALLVKGVFGEQSDKAIDACGRAEKSVVRLVGLINDLLDIEKIEAGKWELVLDTCTISELVERSVDSVQALAQQKGITIAHQPTTMEIFADQGRLIQVLVNFLSNAIKFSPDGSTITVAAKQIPGWIEIGVTDQGRGIPKNDLGKVFNRFEQVEVTDATLKGGTGLGLAVCKGIVEEHKGTIGVDSEEGKGATFWFRIPSLKGALDS